MYEEIREKAEALVLEVLEQAGLKEGSVFVVGCSSSTVCGQGYGKASSMDIAQALFDGIYPKLRERGIYLAAQCCEHLNRAIITSECVAQKQNREIVNVVPQPKAGGSFATITYNTVDDPVAVEHIKADAGIDIGGTMIGMHMHNVVVPMRISLRKIGEAPIICARHRPKYVGGQRAIYDEKLM